MNNAIIDTLIHGVDTNLTDAMKQKLEYSIRSVVKDLESTNQNRSSKLIGGQNNGNGSNRTPTIRTDSELYTNISDMINGSKNGDVAGFGTLMESLYLKNKRYYTIIKDYEMMPILIPQINRVLTFLVNECLSPDIQNKQTFTVKIAGENDTDEVLKDISGIRKETKLDRLLREVYINRYKLGKEYYMVSDYTETFDHMLEMMQKKRMNEASAKLSDLDFIEETFKGLRSEINECSVKLSMGSYMDEDDRKGPSVNENTINLSFENLNIQIDRSPVVSMLEDAHTELLEESYKMYSARNMFRVQSQYGVLSEAVIDTDKFETMVDQLKKKKLQRCTIERLDPARVFKLTVGGKDIGFFYVSDINENSANVVNFAQSLKDQLLKSRAANLNAASKSAEEVISQALAEKIILTFDPNIGINRMEDIDLMHDFIKSNEIYKGNKRLTFYYIDEIFDMSRTDGSVLTNAVFFTKLYATLMLNNIVTKVLRGRGRQIHTVRLGASRSVQRYVQNAIASLTMPETNLGAITGSFEQLINPFNSSSDIIIPTEDDSTKFIETDYIPGQDVNMDEDFLRLLLNSIVSSFNLDSAVIDTANGNLQFARTLSMESLQISNMVTNEQEDTIDAWREMCLRVFYIMGSDMTKQAIDDGRITIEFFEPKSLIMQNTIDEINNAKSYAEAMADVIPEFNEDGMELKRNKFVFRQVQNKVNIDWTRILTDLDDIDVDMIDDKMETKIREIIREYEENIKEQQYGDETGDGIVTEEDQEASEQEDSEYGEFGPEEGEGEELTPEEEELMTPDEEDTGEEEEF